MNAEPKRTEDLRKRAIVIVALAIVTIIVVIMTIELSTGITFPFITAQRDRIIAGELAVAGIALTELIGSLIVHRYRVSSVVHTGNFIRVSLRVFLYFVLTTAILSILAANPTLALGVGTISGFIVGFATQNVLSNIFAGLLLAVIRPTRVGDEITVLGNTGRIVEISHLHTILDTGEKLVYIPNSALLTNPIQHQKEHKHDDLNDK